VLSSKDVARPRQMCPKRCKKPQKTANVTRQSLWQPSRLLELAHEAPVAILVALATGASAPAWKRLWRLQKAGRSGLPTKDLPSSGLRTRRGAIHRGSHITAWIEPLDRDHAVSQLARPRPHLSGGPLPLLEFIRPGASSAGIDRQGIVHRFREVHSFTRAETQHKLSANHPLFLKLSFFYHSNKRLFTCHGLAFFAEIQLKSRE
jgi:hypothetical protein